MTIRDAAALPPPLDAHPAPSSGKRDAPAPKDEGERNSSERQTALGILSKVLGSWGHTGRVLAIAITLGGIAVLGLWFLKADMTLGPLQITRR
jgi:hypothetical protein